MIKDSKGYTFMNTFLWFKTFQVQAGNGASLLHFAEERARKEVELKTIKQQKQQTEGALRQLQDKHMMAVTAYEEHVEQLQDEVERWKRNRYEAIPVTITYLV